MTARGQLFLSLLLGLLLGCDAGGACAGRVQPRVDAPRAAASGGAALQAAPPVRPTGERAGRVVRVRDGDSLVVRIGGTDVEVRLDGVDAPELVQAFGRKARRFTDDLASGREVRLAEKGKDTYARVLAEVFLPDGRSLNRELVSAGYAWWFRKYSVDRDLEERERSAREAGRGLWVDPRAMPPWDFRDSPAGRRRPR